LKQCSKKHVSGRFIQHPQQKQNRCPEDTPQNSRPKSRRYRQQFHRRSQSTKDKKTRKEEKRFFHNWSKAIKKVNCATVAQFGFRANPRLSHRHNLVIHLGYSFFFF
jgi:hypothetical protein